MLVAAGRRHALRPFHGQRYGLGQPQLTGARPDIFVEKADYLCLRDVSLSWSLPKAWLRKLHISDVTLTVSGNTLCYWTAVHGVSPEAATTGGLYTASSTYDTGFSPYPPTRKVLFTAKLTF